MSTPEPLTAEAERQLRRDIEYGGPVTPGDMLALLATLDAARAEPTLGASEGLDVERLAAALRTQSPWKDDETFLDVWRNEAVAVAAEYALAKCPHGHAGGHGCDLCPYKPQAAEPERTDLPCPHPDNYFDRSLCAVDDWMHTRCRDCGVPLDGECGRTTTTTTARSAPDGLDVDIAASVFTDMGYPVMAHRLAVKFVRLYRAASPVAPAEPRLNVDEATLFLQTIAPHLQRDRDRAEAIVRRYLEGDTVADPLTQESRS